MASRLQLRRGTKTEHESFTGQLGETTVDTTNDDLRVHDGSTVGGKSAAQGNKYDGIKQLDNAPLKDRAQYDVAGFYTGTEVGGGQFIYDSSRDKADHNGGTVITPEAIAAWDGTQANLSVLLDWTGTGTGAFVRVDVKHSVSVEWFGAIGDDSFDNYSPIMSALKASVDKYETRFGEGSFVIGSTIDLDTISGNTLSLTGVKSSSDRGRKPTKLTGGVGLARMFYQAFDASEEKRLYFSNFSFKTLDSWDNVNRAPLRCLDIYRSPFSVYEDLDFIGQTSAIHLRTCYFCKLKKIFTTRVNQCIFIDGDNGAGGYGFADHVELSEIAVGGYSNDFGLRIRGSKSVSGNIIDAETGSTAATLTGLVLEGVRASHFSNLYFEVFSQKAAVIFKGIDDNPDYLNNIAYWTTQVTLDGVHGLTNKAGTIELRKGVDDITINNVKVSRGDGDGREDEIGDWLKVNIGGLSSGVLRYLRRVNVGNVNGSDYVPGVLTQNPYDRVFFYNGMVISQNGINPFYGMNYQIGDIITDKTAGTTKTCVKSGTEMNGFTGETADTIAGSRKITVSNIDTLFPGALLDIGAETGFKVTSIESSTNTVWLGREVSSTGNGVSVSYTAPVFV